MDKLLQMLLLPRPAALPAPVAPGEENAPPPTGDEQAPTAQGNEAPSAADVPSPPAVHPRAAASNAALSDGESSSEAYSEDADREGDRIIRTDFKYPVAKHFIPRFR